MPRPGGAHVSEGGGAVVGIAGRRRMVEWTLGSGTSEHGTDDVPPIYLNRGKMAIRLRQVEGEWVALCAVESDPKEGDVYLDDGIHHALACKFAREWDYWQDDHVNRLMDSQKVRDAKEEILKWLESNQSRSSG